MYIYFYDCFARLELARGVIFVLGCCFAPKIQQKKEITMAVPIGCIFMYFVTRIALVLIMRNVSQVVVKTTAIRYAYIWAAMGIMLFVPVFLLLFFVLQTFKSTYCPFSMGISSTTGALRKVVRVVPPAI